MVRYLPVAYSQSVALRRSDRKTVENLIIRISSKEWHSEVYLPLLNEMFELIPLQTSPGIVSSPTVIHTSGILFEVPNIFEGLQKLINEKWPVSRTSGSVSPLHTRLMQSIDE